MNMMEDFMIVNKETLEKTIASIKKHWMIIFTGIAYMMINILANLGLSLFFRGAILGIIGQLIFYIISVAIVSNYLYLLNCVIFYDRLTFQDFKEGFGPYANKLYGIFFASWIASMGLSLLSGMLGSMGSLFVMIIYISAFLGLNSLPESVYQKEMDTLDSVFYSLEFSKDNLINWFVPNIVMWAIIFFLTGNMISDLFTTNVGFVGFGPIGIAKHLFSQLIFSFMMVYRGHLYKLLSTSNPRKRMFMSKF